MIGIVGFKYKNKNIKNNIINNKKGISFDVTTEAGVKEITEKINVHFNLPKDDKPSVALVEDINQLTDQDFFKEAKNGDVLLMYPKSLKAIIYRPSEDKIINYTFITTNTNSGSTPEAVPTKKEASSSASVKEEKTRVVLSNGSKKEDLADSVEKQISSLNLSIEITSKETATKDDYEKTLVIILSEENKTVADKLAKKINGTVTKLSDDKDFPKDTDILIIIGNDYEKQ